MTLHLEQFNSYEDAYRGFGWQIPESFNIGREVCRRHPDFVTRIALVEVRSGGNNTYTFGGLDYLSDKFAVVLSNCGVTRGDVVAIAVAPSAAFAVALLGTLKLGGVAAPLSHNLGSAQLESATTRLRPKSLVIDQALCNSFRSETKNLSGLDSIFAASDDIHGQVVDEGRMSFWREVYAASSEFCTIQTTATDAALIFNTPNPDQPFGKIVHNHASLFGSLPAFEMRNNFDLKEDQVFWTPNDWTSFHSLLGLALPAWYYGHSIVAHPSSHSSSASALKLIEGCEVTAVLFPVDQLELMKREYPVTEGLFDLRLRRILTTNETVPQRLHEWAREALNASIGVSYGMSETGILAASCESWFPSKPDALGKPVPGYGVEIVDDAGLIVRPGKTGKIAARIETLSLFIRRTFNDRASGGELLGTEELGLIEEGYLKIAPRQ